MITEGDFHTETYELLVEQMQGDPFYSQGPKWFKEVLSTLTFEVHVVNQGNGEGIIFIGNSGLLVEIKDFKANWHFYPNANSHDQDFIEDKGLALLQAQILVKSIVELAQWYLNEGRYQFKELSTIFGESENFGAILGKYFNTLNPDICRWNDSVEEYVFNLDLFANLMQSQDVNLDRVKGKILKTAKRVEEYMKDLNVIHPYARFEYYEGLIYFEIEN